MASPDLAAAREAHGAGLPICPLTDATISMLGYPLRFPPFLLVARELVPLLSTPLPVVPFRASACRSPRLEDIVTAMLARDAIAARALLERDLDLVDGAYLVKRVHQEDLAVATSVRMHDRIPLPPVGPEPEKAVIDRLACSNYPQGTLPDQGLTIEQLGDHIIEETFGGLPKIEVEEYLFRYRSTAGPYGRTVLPEVVWYMRLANRNWQVHVQKILRDVRAGMPEDLLVKVQDLGDRFGIGEETAHRIEQTREVIDLIKD